MASIKTKKRFIYTVFCCVFLLGGIEYAVILPTLWLYLYNTYSAPEYMLGLVLSAYSLAAFFSAPIIGSVSDKIGCTKAIFIFCACFQTAGSFLYLVGISEWLCVASRFICGIGGAGEAVVLAEVSRYTSEQERTGIISKLIAMRQVALLAAPGLNIGLRLVNFHIGPIEVNQYTVPGALMAILWLLLIIVIIFIYSEPHEVYDQEKKQKAAALSGEKNKHSSYDTTDDLYDGVQEKQASPALETTDCNSNVSTPSREVALSTPPSVNIHPDYKTEATVPAIPNDMSTSMSGSNEVMASAERIICSSELNNQQEVLQHCQTTGEIDQSDSWSLIDAEEASLLPKPSPNDDYIDNYVSHIDHVIAREGKLGFFCKEYIKDNVVAILTLLFCAMFSQIALEAMCTPVSLEYLDFGELENSILYSLCGVEIIMVFVVVSVLSKRVADRKMILFGSVLLLASNIWLMLFLPGAPKHDRSKNLWTVSIAVAVDVMSLPFLLVCATSLYSKMTRRETQGLSQGLRRAIVGLGTIMAPLWASMVVSRPYLVLGVLIGIQSLALLMCVLSYKRLKGLETNGSEPTTARPSSQTTRPTKTNSPTADVPPNTATMSPQSTQYGSIDSTDSYASRYPSIVNSHQNV